MRGLLGSGQDSDFVPECQKGFDVALGGGRLPAEPRIEVVGDEGYPHQIIRTFKNRNLVFR